LFILTSVATKTEIIILNICWHQSKISWSQISVYCWGIFKLWFSYATFKNIYSAILWQSV